MRNILKKQKKFDIRELQLSIMIIPFMIIAVLCFLFFTFPQNANDFFAAINPFFRDKMTILYLAVNLFVFVFSFFLAFSKYGNIRLGKKDEKPKYSFFAYGAMMFCAGLAGDIIYYSFTEWIYYVNEPFIQSFDSANNLFVDSYSMAQAHSFYFWANYWLYLVLAVCFGFMMHTRKRTKQRFSEALRPLFKDKVDGVLGNIIDVFAVIAIISAVTCSLCFAPPVITNCLHRLFNLPDNNITTIAVLLIIFIIYSISLYHGLEGIKKLSSACVYIFLAFVAYIFLFGGETQFIIESSFRQIGVFLNNLIPLFTYVDPTRKNAFVQNYNVFYLAFWMTWAITVPFFIGIISRGRTIKQTILEGYLFAIPGTLLSFFVIPNYSIGKQLSGKLDLLGQFAKTGEMYDVIGSTISSLPLAPLALFTICVSMIVFCSTSFDSISLTCSYYSYKNLSHDKSPSKIVKQFWATLLILLPVAITFSNASYENVQNIAVIAGFPAAIIIMLVIISSVIDFNRYLKEK
ncbi:MAG: BCCT family transporter [Lachnospiraceae bacterium]|nr:BCCT family transporter [Lachnospiraceae bacterium]